MSYMGYGHWVQVFLLVFICVLKELQQAGSVAPKPFFAAGGLVCAGIGIALLEGDFKKTGFLNFMLFLNVDYASTTIAIGYSFLIFGLFSPVVSLVKDKHLEKSSEKDSDFGEQLSEEAREK